MRIAHGKITGWTGRHQLTRDSFARVINPHTPLYLPPTLTVKGENGVPQIHTVVKGMSGIGLFLGDRLVGINGTHAHPLWPDVLLSGSGQLLDQF